MPKHATITKILWSLFAAVLLFQFFHNRSLWLDEAMLSLNIVQRSCIGLLHPLEYSQVAPILFLWIEKCFTDILGNGEMALRLFPLICSLGSLVLMYYVCRTLTKNRSIALIACCLLGCTPKFIYYASEVKQYATDLSVLLMIWFIAFSENTFLQRHRLLVLSLTGAVAIFISNIAVIPLCTAGLWLLYEAIRKGKDRQAVFVALPVWAVCFAINYLLFIYHHPTAQIMKEYWASSFMPGNPLGTAGRHWLESRLHQVFHELLPGINIPNFYLFLIILYVAGLICLFLKKQYLLVYLSIAPVALHLFLSALQLYPFDLRLILYQLPLYLIVLANGIYQLSAFIARKPASPWLFSSLLTAAFSLQLFRLLPMDNEELRPVILSINKYIKPGQSAYIYYGGKAAFLYYSKTGRVQFGDTPVRYGEFHSNNADYAAELKEMKGPVWVLFAHVYPFDGSRGEERHMMRDLLQRGRLLQEFETYGSAAYLIDLW